MSLPKWVQEAVEKGQELSVCLELWRHATAVERDERAVKREKKKQTRDETATSGHGKRRTRKETDTGENNERKEVTGKKGEN